MQRNFSDEQLGAYLDGALDSQTRSEIESELAASAELRAQLARVQRVNAAVMDVWGELEATPERFSRIVNEGFDRREGAQVTPLRAIRKPAQWAMPIAAGLALFVTAGGGYWAGLSNQRSEPEFAMAVAGSPLFRAIESTPSGQSVQAGEQTITPVLSFAAADGRVCREVELTGSSVQSAAILCRESDAWRVEVLIASGPQSSDGYETVGGDDAVIEQAYQGLGGAGAMSAEQEQALIESGWRR